MTKTERYKIASSHLELCNKRSNLIRIAQEMGAFVQYINIDKIQDHNKENIFEAINLIGVDIIKDFVEKELDTQHTNETLERAYKEYYEATVN